jgi:Peptide-N-glycosidase F, C terminal
VFFSLTRGDSLASTPHIRTHSLTCTHSLSHTPTRLSGHGGADHNCAEFCVTSHNFTFNTHANVRTFSEAGSALGCADHTPIGVVPNEYGTWLYGRDGWCDGLQVVPWRVDISAQLDLRPNATNLATYTALVVGKPPTGNEGSLVMQCYLSFFRASSL